MCMFVYVCIRTQINAFSPLDVGGTSRPRRGLQRAQRSLGTPGVFPIRAFADTLVEEAAFRGLGVRVLGSRSVELIRYQSSWSCDKECH